MSTSKPHRIRNAVLVALFLLASGTLADRYLIAETPAFSFFPSWFQKSETVPISRERNAGVLKSVFEVFDPSLLPFLRSVPIVFDSSADTAKAYRTEGSIGVSPDWDHTVSQSRYRAIYEQRGMKPEDPVFMPRFKTDLLIHEFLHILQFHQAIDTRLFYEAIARWYLDPRYGIPSPGGTVSAGTTKDRRPVTLATNRMKYILWHELYNYRRLNDVPQDGSWKNMQYGPRYRSSEKGVEEFAYLGQEILCGGSRSEDYIKTGRWSDKDWKDKKMRLFEVSPEVIAVYKGVFNPELTRQQTPRIAAGSYL